MHRLLQTKTLYGSGLGVDLFRTGDHRWAVKVYTLSGGIQVKTFSSSQKHLAEDFFHNQKDIKDENKN